MAKRYTIPAGTKCWVRRAGELDWWDHTTTREVRCHARCRRTDDAGRWVFLIAGWEVRVGPRVVGRNGHEPPAVLNERRQRAARAARRAAAAKTVSAE
jgi:hypothetical protein